MARTDRIEIVGPDGLRGEIDPRQMAETAEGGRVQVRLDDGRSLSVPRDLLISEPDGRYRLTLKPDQLDDAAGEAIVIPVVAEELQVSRRVVETGRVRIHKDVREHTELVDEPLFREEVQVERVAVGRPLDQPAEPRYEGDVLIIPVMEEVLFIEKRLMLREEVRISRLRSEVHDPKEVSLREEEIRVDRDNRPAAPDA